MIYSEIDTSVFNTQIYEIDDLSCPIIDGCVNDKGYYKLGEVPSLYFTTGSVVTLPQTCYYVTVVNTLYLQKVRYLVRLLDNQQVRGTVMNI